MKQLGRALSAALLIVGVGCGPDGAADAGRDGQTGQLDGSVDSGPVSVCGASSDCDDGVYCNGFETCAPGEDGAGADGCVPGADPCSDGEFCDEARSACVPDDCANPDADDDGHARIGCGDGDDCDDDDPNRFPGNPEVCDPEGHDEDCDPNTISGNPDMDGDGHIDVMCFNVREDGTENRGTDCDDTSNTVNPDAAESCNGIDDDCDGMIDEGVLETFYRDVDGDGYGDPEDTQVGCTAPVGYVLVAGDCDDRVRAVHPGAADVCNGIDDDCDGTPDPGCECTTEPPRSCGPAEAGVGRCVAGTQSCVNGEWSSCIGAVHPAPTETCDAGDEDCDGLTNDDDPDIASGDPAVTGATVYYRDADGDGYGDSSMSELRCGPRPGWVTAGGDCNDADSDVRPMAPEICDGIDNDCNGHVDDRPGGCDCINGTTRPCGTDVGECTVGVETCISGGWSSCSGDGPRTEVCDGTNRDEDCDGQIDEGLRTTYYYDGDGDNFGDPTMPMSACMRPVQTATNANDCDDANAAVNPNATEICDGIDNDCDGLVDPGCGCTVGMTRPCGSDVGICMKGVQTCSASGEWSTACEGEVRPGTETCNGLDDDCDGRVDEAGAVGERLFHRDEDGDGYGSSVTARRCPLGDGSPPAGWVDPGGPEDCVDRGSRANLIHPGAGYQTEGHCGGYPTTTTCPIRPGQPACRVDVGGLPGCVSPSFDYNCNSVVEPEPQVMCTPLGGGLPGCSGNGPLHPPSASDCGKTIPAGRCFLGCSPTNNGTMTLGCR